LARLSERLAKIFHRIVSALATASRLSLYWQLLSEESATALRWRRGDKTVYHRADRGAELRI